MEGCCTVNKEQADLDHILRSVRSVEAGRFGVLSTGEKLAAALVLNRADLLASMKFTIAEAIERVGSDWLGLIPRAAKLIQDEDAS